MSYALVRFIAAQPATFARPCVPFKRSVVARASLVNDRGRGNHGILKNARMASITALCCASVMPGKNGRLKLSPAARATLFIYRPASNREKA